MGFPHTPFLTVTGTLSLYRQTTAPFGAFLFFAALPREPGHAALKKGHVTDGAPPPSARASLRWESPASQVNIILSVSQPKPPTPEPAKNFFSHPPLRRQTMYSLQLHGFSPSAHLVPPSAEKVFSPSAARPRATNRPEASWTERLFQRTPSQAPIHRR